MAVAGLVVNGRCTTDFAGESEQLISEGFSHRPIVKFLNDVEGMA